MTTLSHPHTPDSSDTELSLNEQLRQRKQKLDRLRQQRQAFPNDFRPDTLAAALLKAYNALSAEALETAAIPVKIAGRMMTHRVMGKASFAHIQDMSGQIQLYIREQAVSAAVYEHSKHFDLGDIIGAEGTVFKTKAGELSVRVTQLYLITKALRPLPDKFHGLNNQEKCYRQRYLDLIVNEKTRSVFNIRAAVIQGIRHFFTSRHFAEVETPMMHPIPGGATAKPFVTHHNALNKALYLRIAPELYLKRLIVGGMERVFEINRNFRNEGLSTRHNPEFTMLEFYQAYADYEDLITLTQTLLCELAQNIFGTPTITYQEQLYDFSKPMLRMSIQQAIVWAYPDLSMNDVADKAKITAWAHQCEVPIEPDYSLGQIQYAVFEKMVEHKLDQPTFITEFPIEVSPLARKNQTHPMIADRFEFFMAGREIANGFSELNDPEDQAERFKAQVKNREAGDAEAMFFDQDYVLALEHGMPPTAGEGIGIDRLVMLFADVTSIRDVILFPQLR